MDNSKVASFPRPVQASSSAAPAQPDLLSHRLLGGLALLNLAAAGLDTLAGEQAVAILGQRENLVVDSQLFLEATGPKGLAAMVVRVEPARELLSGSDLEAISTRTVTPVLRVEPIQKRVA